MQNRNCRVKVCKAGNYKHIHTLDKKILQLYNKYMGKSVNIVLNELISIGLQKIALTTVLTKAYCKGDLS